MKLISPISTQETTYQADTDEYLETERGEDDNEPAARKNSDATQSQLELLR